MPEPAKRLTRDERRAAFLDVAADLVRQRGAEALTMEGLATHASVNKSIVYRFFSNRDEVVLALYEREAAALDERARTAVDAASTYADKQRALLGIFFDLTLDRDNVMRLLEEATGLSPALEDLLARRTASAVAWYAEMICDEYEIPPRAALLAATSMGAAARGVVSLFQRTRWRRDEVIDVWVEMNRASLAELERRCADGFELSREARAGTRPGSRRATR